MALTDTLITALSEGQAAAKELEDQRKTIEKLFAELASKQAEIDALKKELRTISTKERKWRLQAPQISSPVVLSDEIEHTPRVTTPARSSSPIPHVQVESSPPKKRQRTRQSTPLREVQNTKHAPSRTEAAIAAIPSLAEDGEDVSTKRKTPKPSKIDAATKKGAQGRLDGLLATPASTRDTPQPERPHTGNLKTAPVPSLRKSTSDVSDSVRRKPRFMPPKAQDGRKPLRSRPVSELCISDFKLNPEYVEVYDRPGGQPRRPFASILGDELSDEALLQEMLGEGADEKIASMTELAKVNLLRHARAKKIADGFAQSKQRTTESGQPLQPNFWDTGFPSSQEQRKNREEVAVKVREEVARRYAEACHGNGRWIFADSG